MRNLDFIVIGQALSRDQRCDFSGLVAGSTGYLRARFTFCKEWAGCKKVAIFTCKGKGYPVPLEANMCQIPAEALTGSPVQVRVFGRRPGFEVATGVVAFSQTTSR